MASNAGFVSVPVMPTFQGMGKAFADRLINPAKKAGKEAGDAISGGLDGAVKNLEKQVKASSANLDKLDREYEKKRRSQSLRETQEQEAKELLRRAEERYAKAVEEGSKTADTAYKQLSAAKVKAKKAANDLANAQADTNSAEKKHKDQLDDYTQTLEKFKNAQNDANGALEKSKGGMDIARDGLDGIMGKASDMGGPIGGVADMLSDFKLGPAAGVAAVGGAFVVAATELGKFSSELEDSRVDMQNQFGLSADAARDMQSEIADALGSGQGYEATAEAVTSIAQVWGDEISHMGGQTAAQLSDDFMAFNKTFERSAEETASTVDVMLNSGMVDTAQEGLDLLTAGMQNVPAAMRDEVFDATNEYSKHFANLGISGEEAMAMLSSAAEHGQYAIDKTGDSIKEFSVLAIDPAKAEIFEEIGLNADDMANSVAGGGDSAKQALQDTAQALLDIEDPGARAAKAVELFGAPIEDLGVDQIPGFLESLTAGTDGMGDFEGSAQEMADNTAGTFSGMVAGWKGQIHGWAIDATLRLNEWGGEAADAIINSPIVGAIGQTLGDARDLASGIGDILFRGDFDGMPFGIQEDSAFVDFLFTAREEVIGFKDDVVGAWGEITTAFAGGDDGYGFLAEIFGEEKAEDIINIIADIGERFTEFKDNLIEGFEQAQEFVQPIFDFLAEFFTEQMGETFSSIGGALGDIAGAFLDIGGALGSALWEILLSVYDLFKELWDLLSPLLLPVLKIIAGIVGGLLVGAFMAFVGAIRLGAEIIEFLAGIIGWAVDNFLVPLLNIAGDIASFFIDGFVGAIRILGDYFGNIFGAMSSIWDGFTDLLFVGYDFIVSTIFGGLGAGLQSLRDNFGLAVDAIGKIWDGLKEAAAAPVRFMIDAVWNNGIIRAIDAVAGLIGMEGPDEIPIGFRTGGILPGYSRMADGDDQLVPMRRGEGVLVSEALQDERSRRLFLTANEQAKQGKSFGDFMSDYVAGYANGGIVGSLNSIMQEFYPELQMTSHFRPGDSGYHGKNMAGDFSNTGSGMPSTPAMQAAAAFMFGNYGDQLEQLIHHPARNIGSGRDVGDGFGYYGAAEMANHTDHIHLAALKPLVDPSGVVQMMPYDGESGGGFSLMGALKRLWDGAINKIAPYPDEEANWFSQIPGAFLTSAAEKLWEFITGKAGSGSYDGTGGVSGQAESWREMAIAAMKRNGFNADDPAQVNAMIAQIHSESGGIPDRNQEIVDMNGTGASAGQGLLQIIPGTFADHRDPSLPDDRTDPWANMNAALRYYRWRYGDDLTTMWGRGHGYAHGGIVDMPELFTRDLGGWVPDGALVRNTSGRDELMLPPELSKAMAGFFADYPEAAAMLLEAAEHIESASEYLHAAADYDSVEGVTARQSVRGVLDWGLDLPGSDVVLAVLDGEEALWANRERHLGHLDNLAEKEKAIADARKALDELESSEDKLSRQDQRKLDDAKKAVEEAKADAAKAKSDEKRASATEKVAKAEEKLKRVREDLAENAEENATKRAEEITAANEAVIQAEEEYAAAREQQVKDLDHIVVLSQDNFADMAAQATSMAGQLVSMGAPAAAVSQGLGAITGALGSAAAMAGPAGVTLGMAIQAVGIGIEIVNTVIQKVEELIEFINAARLAALQTTADGMQVIAEYAELVVGMQQNVASLQQELVRGMQEQRTAELNLRIATQDRLVAEAEGMLSVHEARLALEEEIRKTNVAAQLRMMGLFEDWDSYLSYQALVSQGMLEEWSDAAISALFTYEAARAKALQGELSARVDQINAEAALAEATRQNMRNQQDLLTAQERLIRMSAEVAGVDLVEATATAQVAKLVAQMAEVQQKMDSNILGKAGAFLGTGGPWSNEYRGQQAAMQSMRAALDAVLAETGVSLSNSQINKAIEQMKWVSATEGDPMAVLRQIMPELVAAETALKIDEVMKPIDDARDSIRDAEREAEDFTSEIDLYEKLAPLEEMIKGLDYTIQDLEHSSDAWAEGNESLRAEYLAAAKANRDAARELGVNWQLDDQFATGAVREQIAREVNISVDGLAGAEDVERIVQAAMDAVGVNSKVRVSYDSASAVAMSRRGGLA